MKRFFCLISASLLTFSILSHAEAASPVKARPLTGVGVLVMQGTPSGFAGEASELQLYREPKVGRLARIPVDRLPKLSPYITLTEGVVYAIVSSIRPGWFCLLYDDAERGGWVEKKRGWEFIRWGQFLYGRSITLLPGIRQEYTKLRQEPSLASPLVESTVKNEPLKVVKVEGDWVLVSFGKSKSGWLRWRDDNSRLLVSINMQIQPLKH